MEKTNNVKDEKMKKVTGGTALREVKKPDVQIDGLINTGNNGETFYGPSEIKED